MNWTSLGVVLGCSVCWAWAQASLFLPTLYDRLFALSVVVWLLLWSVGPRLGLSLHAGFRFPGWLPTMLGLISGVLLAGVTLACLKLSEQAWPELIGHVQGLRADHGFDNVWLKAPMLLAIIGTEELLWRELAPRVFSQRLRPRVAWPLGLALYVAAQAGLASWPVLAAAATLGSFWTYLRLRYNSLVPGLLSHVIWTSAILTGLDYG